MINSRDLNDLHPTLKRGALELQNRLKEKGYNLSFSATYRDYEYQDYLYSQGRTTSGQIVTNAKGGESIHNFKLAFDIFNNVQGNLYPEEFLQLAGAEWVKMGGVWGGDWTSFPDKPHFQFTDDLTIKLLQSGQKVPENAKMQWEITTPDTEEELRIFEVNQKINILGTTSVFNAYNINDTVYVPVRKIFNEVGYIVDWDSSTQTIVIDKE